VSAGVSVDSLGVSLVCESPDVSPPQAVMDNTSVPAARIANSFFFFNFSFLLFLFES
jgi:hypothetical protein